MAAKKYKLNGMMLSVKEASNMFKIKEKTIRKRMKAGASFEKAVLTKVKKNHNLSKHYIYGIWSDIKSRCYNKSNKRYKRYGGRGIKMSDEFLNNINKFYEHLGDRPTNKHSIDRINNNGNYERGNIRWATPKQQGNNRSTNVFGTVFGVNMNLKQAADKYNLHGTSIGRRMGRLGESMEDSVIYLIKYKKEDRIIKDICKKYKISRRSLLRRMRNQGETMEQAKNALVKYNEKKLNKKGKNELK